MKTKSINLKKQNMNNVVNFTRKCWISFVFMLCITSLGFGQTISMSTGNCVATANEIQFDLFVTNTGAVSLQFKSAVIRLTHSAAILAGGTNTIVFSYVSGSDFPLSWPPSSSPAFIYTPATRLFRVSTGNSIYVNGGTCAAPNIASGATKEIGRFSLKNTAQNFVAGANVGLAWSISGMIGYINCAAGSTTFNTASGNTILAAPCSMTIPGCTSSTVSGNPGDQSVCNPGTATFNGTFTNGAPAPTLIWQVQTGGVGLFTDLTETAPYSNTATNTLSISNPNISLSTNRYRLKASNTCGDVFTNDALLTVNPTINIGTVSGTATLCAGSLFTFSSDGDAGGSWSSSNPVVASVSSTGIVTALNAGNTNITYTINAGCGSPQSAFKALAVGGTASLAGVTGGPSVCITAAVQPSTTQPSGTSFSDGSCNTIATILPSGLSPVSGSINTCVRVEDVVHTYHNMPYLQRVYDLVPAINAATATATVTLYYTQAEFSAYNAAKPAPYPPLPVDAADALNNKANLRITQFHGTGTYPGNYNGGTVDLINPVDAKIVWSGAPLNRWEVTFDIVGFSGFYLHTTVTNAPLPINLLSFSGRNNGNSNLLEWATSSEQNSNYFELQRSTDGINFVKAATITAAGNSSTNRNYNYNDNISSFTERLFYYRLKQVDISGEAKYSTIVKIKLGNKGFDVEASPNPFADQLRVQVDAIQKENATITLNSLDGRKILKQNTSLSKGSNVVLLDKLDNLAGGVYLLTVVTDSEKITVKVIKQK